MARLSFVLGAAVRDLRRTGAAGAGGVLVAALAVLVAGSALLGLATLGRLTTAWRADLHVVAVLSADRARAETPAAVVAAARALPGAASVRYVSPAEALADLRRDLGPAGAGLERLPANPVPPRVEITPAPGLGAAGLRGLIDALRRLPAVEDVEAAVGWVEPSERVERGLRVGGLVLAALLAVTAVAAIAGGTGVARRARADEAAILRLAGAPAAVIRGPLVLQAVLQGVAGAGLGWGALVFLSEVGTPWGGAWLRATLGVPVLPLLSGPLGAALLGGGAGAGLLGGLGAGRP